MKNGEWRPRRKKSQETEVGRLPHASTHYRWSLCFGGGRLGTLPQGTAYPTHSVLCDITQCPQGQPWSLVANSSAETGLRLELRLLNLWGWASDERTVYMVYMCGSSLQGLPSLQNKLRACCVQE